MARMGMAAAALAAAVAVPSLVAAPASAAEGDCSDGVIVIVQVGDGDVERGCAEGDPKDGFEALEKAGFTVQQNEMGMVCQVQGHPSECAASPPPDAYWSYWWAPKGKEEWEYATLGPADADPAPGDIEGWRFVDSAQNPPKEPPKPATFREAPAEDAASAAPGESQAPGDAETQAGSDADEPAVTAPKQVEEKDSGSPVATIIAVVAIAVIAVSLGVRAWAVRRR